MYQAFDTATEFITQDRQLKSNQKPSACPWCGSQRIAIFISGMPVYIPELENELDNGETDMNGLPKASNDPNWQCTECGAQFFRALHLVGSHG